MTREKALEKALKAILEIIPTPYCSELHHKKSDRHEDGELCPVEDKLRKVIANAEELVP